MNKLVFLILAAIHLQVSYCSFSVTYKVVNSDDVQNILAKYVTGSSSSEPDTIRFPPARRFQQPILRLPSRPTTTQPTSSQTPSPKSPPAPISLPALPSPKSPSAQTSSPAPPSPKPLPAPAPSPVSPPVNAPQPPRYTPPFRTFPPAWPFNGAPGAPGLPPLPFPPMFGTAGPFGAPRAPGFPLLPFPPMFGTAGPYGAPRAPGFPLLPFPPMWGPPRPFGAPVPPRFQPPPVGRYVPITSRRPSMDSLADTLYIRRQSRPKSVRSKSNYPIPAAESKPYTVDATLFRIDEDKIITGATDGIIKVDEVAAYDDEKLKKGLVRVEKIKGSVCVNGNVVLNPNPTNRRMYSHIPSPKIDVDGVEWFEITIESRFGQLYVVYEDNNYNRVTMS